MRERQILFSGPMVRAIQDGRKTQTRRVVQPQPQRGDSGLWVFGDFMWSGRENGFPVFPGQALAQLCPYGRVGDRLSVRETFFAYGRWETRYSAKKGRDEWHFVDMTIECDRPYQYAADDPDVPVTSSRHGGVTPEWWKRPAIFMPRVASRITLEVTDVGVERLQEIDWEDAIAEGIPDPHRAVRRVDPVKGCVAKYRELWDSLNAARGYGWDENPWVWVVEFKRIAL